MRDTQRPETLRGRQRDKRLRGEKDRDGGGWKKDRKEEMTEKAERKRQEKAEKV